MYGKRPGWLCLSPKTLRRTGICLAVIGGAMIIAFVPFRYWMVMIGLVFLLVGAGILMIN